MVDQDQQGQKGHPLDLGGVLETEILELVVHPKTEPHDHGPCIGHGQRGDGIQGQGVRKNIDDEPQQKRNDHTKGPVAFEGIPIKEDDIDHRVDEIHEIQGIENQDLGKDQKHKTEYVQYNGAIHWWSLLRVLGSLSGFCSRSGTHS